MTSTTKKRKKQLRIVNWSDIFQALCGDLQSGHPSTRYKKASGFFIGCVVMPFAAPKPCTFPSCHILVRDGSGRCEKHKRVDSKAHDQRRGTAHERGYTGAWQKARAGFLRSHPLCVRCLAADQTVAANVVDHIVPHKGDKVLFWEHANWQALCKPCHDRKTAAEDGGFGHPAAAGVGAKNL